MRKLFLRKTNRPKILFIGPIPPPLSGPELGMKLFLESGLRSRFSVMHLKTNVRKSNHDKGILDLKMVIAFFRFHFTLLSILAFRRPRLAYYPVTPTALGWLGRDAPCILLCRLFRVKTVIHMRGSHFRLNFEQFNPLIQMLVRFACRGVDLVLVQAEYLKSQFSGMIFGEKIKVLYNAIDTKNYKPDVSKSSLPMKVLFLGHLTKAKGYCDLIRAIPKVVGLYPDIEFHFAGTLRTGERGVFFDQFTGHPIDYEDPMKSHKEIAEGTFGKNYIFHGVVDGQDKLKLLRDADIFVSPSYSEGFSRALLEALSVGKAVVCTPVGAHREVLEKDKNAIFFPPGDIDSLINAIVCLIGDSPKRTVMGETNSNLASCKFDIEEISSKLGDYFESVISTKKSSGNH